MSMAERGLALTYEAIRQWCKKLGHLFANDLRRRRPRLGDKWHMYEVFIKIRLRERGTRRFKSAGRAQRFLSAFGIISQHFRPKRHLLTAQQSRDETKERFVTWLEVAGISATA